MTLRAKLRFSLMPTGLYILDGEKFFIQEAARRASTGLPENEICKLSDRFSQILLILERYNLYKLPHGILKTTLKSD